MKVKPEIKIVNQFEYKKGFAIIYCFFDLDIQQIRYIGLTTQPLKARLRVHFNETYLKRKEFAQWMESANFEMRAIRQIPAAVKFLAENDEIINAVNTGHQRLFNAYMPEIKPQVEINQIKEVTDESIDYNFDWGA